MHYEEFLRLKRQRPFQPFRVLLTNGEVYQVFRGDHILVGKSLVVIGFPIPGQEGPFCADHVVVDMTEVSRIELVQPLAEAVR